MRFIACATALAVLLQGCGGEAKPTIEEAPKAAEATETSETSEEGPASEGGGLYAEESPADQPVTLPEVTTDTTVADATTQGLTPLATGAGKGGGGGGFMQTILPMVIKFGPKLLKGLFGGGKKRRKQGGQVLGGNYGVQ